MTKSDRPLIVDGVADPDLDALVDQIRAGHRPEEGGADLPGDLRERVPKRSVRTWTKALPRRRMLFAATVALCRPDTRALSCLLPAVTYPLESELQQVQ
jgi:hypothetical protein